MSIKADVKFRLSNNGVCPVRSCWMTVDTCCLSGSTIQALECLSQFGIGIEAVHSLVTVLGKRISPFEYV